MNEHPTAVHERYRRRRDRFAAEWADLDRRSSRLAHLRFGLALAVVAGLTVGFWGAGVVRPGWVTAAALAAVGFVVAVRVHARVRRDQGRAGELRDLNDEALARLDRVWERLPRPPDHDDPPALALDLDLLGAASLRHLLGPVGTPLGDATVTRWLLAPASADEVSRRQGAVWELAGRLDLRQDLTRLGREVSRAMPDTGAFLAWAEGANWLAVRPALAWAARVLALVTVGLIVAAIAGWVPPLLWLLPLPLNLALTWAVRSPVGTIYRAVSLEPSPFPALGEQLASLRAANLEDPRLRDLAAQLVDGESAALAGFARLQRLTTLADMRHSGMVHGLLQAVLLWDLHVVGLLEGWQTAHGARSRGWLEQLGRLEALAALAALVHDHPGWCRPSLLDGGDLELTAAALGHPLLPPDGCVGNDVSLGPPGTFLLVTGSNMSGKSTLLRACGVNAVLALAGGPACARSLSLPELALGTSFRVRDSLEQGLSYFMAELRRLKEVVDLAEDSPLPVLYLFDEILLGTNAEERRIAVQKVLSRLRALGAVGAVATHDLSLATAEGLADACVPIHFTEQFDERDGRTEMSFDYRVRPGLAPTTNALKLLALVGLDDDPAP